MEFKLNNSAKNQFQKKNSHPIKKMRDEQNEITFQIADIITSTTKCLGMTWPPKKDIFHFNSYQNLGTEKSPKLTKRGMASLIPSIYNPAGLLQPFIIQGKLILQGAWVYKNAQDKTLDCDDKLPEDIRNRWLKWINDIKYVRIYN